MNEMYNPAKPGIPRRITLWEVYEQKFGSTHGSCMDKACEEAKEKSKLHNIPIECFNISALTFQHWQKCIDKENYLKAIRDSKNKERG